MDGWKTRPQIELANLYHDDPKNRDVYLSALVVRYWNIFAKAAYFGKNIFQEEDAYDWYIESVLFVLDTRPWLNEESSLYNDEKAFEKAVNVKFFCTKTNWFQASNRYKRKLNHGTASLETMLEDYGDFASYSTSKNELEDDEYKYLVTAAFESKKYLLAIIFDIIINNMDLSEVREDSKLVSDIIKEIRNLPDNYPKLFAEQYSLNKEKVVESFKIVYNMSRDKLKSSVEMYIYKLRANLLGEILNAD